MAKRGKSGIYKIEGPTGKLYFGRCINFSGRLCKYKYLKCEGQRKIYNAIKRYGWDNFKVSFSPCIESVLNMCEKVNIAHHDSKNSGYNCTYGGEGMSGYKHSAAAKAKIANANKGKVFTEEHKKKLSESAKGKKKRLGMKTSDETKKKIALARTGTKHSAETKKKMSDGKIGVKRGKYKCKSQK